jgi:integrase
MSTWLQMKTRNNSYSLAKVATNGNSGRMRKHKVRPYRDNNRPHLKFVVNTKEGGKRARQFFETKKDAETFVQQKNIELVNGGAEAAQFPSALRIMAGEAARLLSPFGKSITDAVSFYLPHLQAMNRTCSFRALTDELLSTKAKDGASARYLGDLRSRLGQFATSMKDKSVAAITAREVDEWLRALEVSPTTRNNFRRVLIVAFNFAVDRGYSVTNPAEKSAKAKEIEGTVGILTVAQTARLLEAADAELLPFVAIGAFAGLRRAELERLDWSEVDLKSKLIEVKAVKAKSARRRFVKIRPNLVTWLAPYANRRGKVTPLDYRELLDEARQAAKISEWPQNALRHGFASYNLAKFKDAAALALDLGHMNANLVFNNYRQVVRPKDAARYWKISPMNAARGKIVAMSAAA